MKKTKRDWSTEKNIFNKKSFFKQKFKKGKIEEINSK